jgi:sn-1 stearoyl-lipid 9-desaturase
MDHSIRLLPKVYCRWAAPGRRRIPTAIDGVRQTLHSMNFVADRRRALHALFESTHYLMIAPTVVFFVRYVTWSNIVMYVVMLSALTNLANTIWYHRYCSHRAFRFSHPIWPRLCLWLNPLGFREEIYALIHHVHHDRADQPDDPHGRQIGWVANYVETSFEVDTNVSEREFARIKARLEHVGMPFSSLESFRRWGCVEWIPHYLARWTFASAFWISVWYSVGGVDFVLAWLAAMFSYHALLRDFDFRGHGSASDPKQVDGWDFDRQSYALNQRFYGWLVGEWHNNHHAFRVSANTAFLPGQFDVPFLVIKVLHRLGVVSRYNDHRAQFERRYAAELAHHGRRVRRS